MMRQCLVPKEYYPSKVRRIISMKFTLSTLYLNRLSFQTIIVTKAVRPFTALRLVKPRDWCLRIDRIEIKWFCGDLPL